MAASARPARGPQLVNLYEHLPAEYRSKRMTYPNYETMRINLPNRFLVVAPSGSGKSNLTLNLIQMFNCFRRFYIFAKNLDEPLWSYFTDKLREVEERLSKKAKKPVQVLMVASNDLADLPALSDIHKEDGPHLVVIDDFITEKSKAKLEHLEQYFIAGRKKDLSCMFLSQNYYTIPKLIRQNSDVVIIKRLGAKRDIKALMSEFATDIDAKTLEKLYRESDTSQLLNFFMVCGDCAPEERYRKNFTPFSLEKEKA